MKRTFTLLFLTLPVSTYAMGSASAGPTPEAASFFLGGCGLILMMLIRLAWKTRRTETPNAELSSRYEARYETSEFPIPVGFPNSAHAGGRDS
jgi:hypothetical protein